MEERVSEGKETNLLDGERESGEEKGGQEEWKEERSEA